MSKLPLISIISVSYNAGVNAVLRTINSIKNLHYTNIEYIVIDNCSNDGSEKILAENNGIINKLIVEPDKGIYDAMNKGVKNATGDWIIFMNMGDEFFNNPGLLNQLVDSTLLEKFKLIYGNVLMRNTNFDYQLNYSNNIQHHLKYGILRLNHQTIFAHKSMFEPTKPFNDKLRIAGDAYWWNGVLAKEGEHVFGYFNQTISIFYEDGVSSSPNSFLKMYKEDMQILKAYNNHIWHKIQFTLNFIIRLIRVIILYKIIKPLGIYTIYRKLKYN